ncbi:hypothetical protein [Stappia sp.]|uniref:hypothetical protein n=1 Tax=Stappia sp. TaxID=1870903 RepID=UPI003D09ADB7
MTAEIAILNMSAACLAADSAVTIGVGENKKVYNSVNKIFELSKKHPVAIMIYGNINFMNLPLEVLIKEFRKKIPDDGYNSLVEYADKFIEYLGNDIPYEDVNEWIGAVSIIRSVALPNIKSACETIFRDSLTSGRPEKNKFGAKFSRKIDELIVSAEEYEDIPNIKNIKFPKDIILEAIDDDICDSYFIGKISKANKNKIWKYFEIILRKNIMSKNLSGLVFCGFGNKDLCPTLVSYEIDGIIGGQLKIQQTKSVDIDRNKNPAFVSGFAQKDMVESFVDGASSDLLLHIQARMLFAIFAFRNKVLSLLVPDEEDDDLRKELSKELQAPAVDIIKNEMRRLDEYMDKNYSQPLLQMVRFLPKSELPLVAGSLIELTSLKRKVSMEADTVGGDVDVAVISKAEGFVWIRRKHYFQPDLNTAYFRRF